MTTAFLDNIRVTLTDIEADGLFKRERLITTPQATRVQVGGREVINLCTNNYLGLADHPDLIAAATKAMQEGVVAKLLPGRFHIANPCG